MNNELQRITADQNTLSYTVVKEEFYKSDFALLDRFQGFSSEILRLSLVGLGVLGFFVTRGLAEAFSVKICLAGGLLFFGLSAAFALAHRYMSTDGMYYHLRSLKLYETEKEDAAQNMKKGTELYKSSEKSMLYSAALLGLGALAIAVGFILATFL